MGRTLLDLDGSSLLRQNVNYIIDIPRIVEQCFIKLAVFELITRRLRSSLVNSD